MSPKGLILLLVVGLCAVQMASAQRQSRPIHSVADLLSSAQVKLAKILRGAEDAASSSVETVFNFINDLEKKALDKGTEALAKRNVNINLTSVAEVLKDDLKICAKDAEIKEQAKAVVLDVTSCVTKDVKALLSLSKNMKKLWHTASTLPASMKKVAKQCSAHADTDVSNDVLKANSTANALVAVVAELNPDHDLHEESTQLLKSVHHSISKRELWAVTRIVRCVQSVYELTKTDIVNLPAEMMAIAANAYTVVQGAQRGIPTCVAKKVTQNLPAVSKIGLKVSACVATSFAQGEELQQIVADNPGLPVLQDVAKLAEKLGALKNATEIVSEVVG